MLGYANFFSIQRQKSSDDFFLFFLRSNFLSFLHAFFWAEKGRQGRDKKKAQHTERAGKKYPNLLFAPHCSAKAQSMKRKMSSSIVVYTKDVRKPSKKSNPDFSLLGAKRSKRMPAAVFIQSIAYSNKSRQEKSHSREKIDRSQKWRQIACLRSIKSHDDRRRLLRPNYDWRKMPFIFPAEHHEPHNQQFLRCRRCRKTHFSPKKSRFYDRSLLSPEKKLCNARLEIYFLSRRNMNELGEINVRSFALRV